jgi:hypothetical protein
MLFLLHKIQKHFANREFTNREQHASLRQSKRIPHYGDKARSKFLLKTHLGVKREQIASALVSTGE